MKLYGYWRSSAAYRVRIALNLKQLSYDNIPVHLVKNGGEQHSADYKALNPAELVPTLLDNDLSLNQSLAIIEYLEQQYPEPSVLPADAATKAQVRALALDIACDIHPLNNLRVLQYLTGPLALSDQQKQAWIIHWLEVGFSSFEQRLAAVSGKFCVGDTVTLADICLVPQVYNAKRFGLDMSLYPRINAIVEQCQQLDAFKLAAPEAQPDAQ